MFNHTPHAVLIFTIVLLKHYNNQIMQLALIN